MHRSCRRESCTLWSCPLPCPSNYSYRCFSSCLQVIMLRNDIHHCKASGIFLRLSAGGLIADNNIHSNCEAGVDIRKGANPLVLVCTPLSNAGRQRALSLTCCFSPRGSRDPSPSTENTDWLYPSACSLGFS